MRRSRARFPLLLAALAATPAAAQTIVTSAAPQDVDVTIYRDPGRSADEPFELEWLEGYALISETRQLTIPAGESEIRFEGVAGGIVPQSAIVRGFPEGIIERNRDAYLLSPETLVDRSLGRRVHIRRTSLATGAVREEEAVIRSGAAGAVVLQTSDGFEALRCTGLPETLIHDGVPAGLSSTPTLSVRARSSRPVAAAVTLSYLANGFDWQADYIATVSPDGERVDLFAWLTLANGDETSFFDADTQAVAGRLNRQHVETDELEAGPLELRCWPQAGTSDLPLGVMPDISVTEALNRVPGVSASRFEESDADSIVVTAATRAQQEDLGDLKLYRIPEPVTVAANSQKQVAFLEQAAVSVAFVYRQRLDPENDDDVEAANRVLVTRNRTREGLGVPLPAGSIRLFTEANGRPILIGQGSIEDRAVGEDVEIETGEAPGVRSRIEEGEYGDDWQEYVLVVTNDQAASIRYEAEFDLDEDEAFRPRARLSRRDGRPLWAVTIPANGTATLRYRVVDVES